MAKQTGRAGGHEIPAVPPSSRSIPRPTGQAPSGTPAVGPAHPRSRKPNTPTQGGGHGGGNK